VAVNKQNKTIKCRKKYSFSHGGLVCDLLLRQLRGYLPEGALPEEDLESHSERALLGEHWSSGALPSGGVIGRYVRQLGRLDCWNFLARECMPAHKHCEMLLPTRRSSIN